MIRHEVTRRSAWIGRTAGMASALAADFIDLRSFVTGEITLGSPRWYGISRERAGSNAKRRQLRKSILRLLCLSFQVGDLTFNSFIKAWTRFPVWVKGLHLRDCILPTSLRYCQPNCLRGRWLKPFSASAILSLAVFCAACVLRTRYPHIVGCRIGEGLRTI
jgi:hypothetical protein